MSSDQQQKPSASTGPTPLVLVLRRLVGGTVGGVLQALSSHPFDTIKSQIQIGKFQSIGEGFGHTFKNEGLRGFYRGVTPPLFLNGFYNALLFGINQQMTNVVTPAGFVHGRDTLEMWRVALAGQLTAPLYCLAMVPMEVVKVKLQTQPIGADGTKLYSGPIDCLIKNTRDNGLRAAFAGYTPMLMSRIVGLPFYFSGYHFAKNNLITNFGVSDSSLIIPMASGVVAGFAFWTSNYPFDLMKTKVQASKVPVSPIEMARQTYKAGGARSFYKGFGVCLLRSIPANSTVWIGVEYTTRFMANNGW